MGTDTEHDADTLRHSVEADVIHAGMIREGLRIARGLTAPADVHTLEPMEEAFAGAWCSDHFPDAGQMVGAHRPATSSHAGHAPVCAFGDSVRLDTSDSEGGECV